MFKKVALLFILHTAFGIAQEQEQMLLGKISVSELREAPYGNWFDARYKKYKVKDTQIKDLKSQLNAIDIKIFMGTWCSDSRREVPRFYKIMEVVEFPSENIELIAVDRVKTTPDHLETGLNIIRVPTFIFYKNGEELGRIVENPIESLEADMLRILSGKAYRHAYAD